MSTFVQPHPEPAWKQEVARRLAAHKSRKGAPTAEQASQPQNFGNSLAAEAAARVAARYAKAPSYSQMQAEEARMAVRAAEIATKVALEAQAAAHSALAELHAASEPRRGPAVVESIVRPRVEPELASANASAIAIAAPETAPEPQLAAQPQLAAEPRIAAELDPFTPSPIEPVAVAPHVIEPAPAPQPSPFVAAQPEPSPVITQQLVDGHTIGIRWEPDTPVRVLQPKAAPVARDPEPAHFELAAEDWWTPAQVEDTLHNEPFAVDSDSARANLIEFPRELVATRKLRPRLIEPAASASTAERQLSIFEVDPGAISTEPDAAASLAPAPAPSWSDPAWSAPARSATAQWSGIQLDEHPLVQQRPEPAARPRQQIHLAPLGRRLMAMSVDGCLILAAFFAGATMLAARMQSMPAPRSAEVMCALGLVLAGFLYNALFSAIGVSTPGMRYAGIALSTFDDESPTRAQLRRRLGSMVLSLAPLALGMAWSIFDDDHLTWHDRISQTYLRKR